MREFFNAGMRECENARMFDYPFVKNSGNYTERY
jgi:hypothetical protein